MTEQEALAQATQEIEDAKPLKKQVNNEEATEYSEAEYEQAIEDRKNSILDEYNNGYKRSRQDAYPPIAEQLDMQYWDGVNDTTTWADAIAKVKADYPKPE
tara:strand:+ start:1088 stop:1390 length:303 start_codon:yes stop_codon:yes gene_type:complete